MNRDLIAPLFVLLIALPVCVVCILRISMLVSRNYPGWRRVSELIVLSLVILAAAAAGAGATYNAVATRHFFALHPVPGNVYIVDGYKMHLYCTGEGSPTIVLDAGLGFDSLIWANVQPQLSKTTQVCSYDRAGFGWSDPRPDPQDADRIAGEMHGLLAAAGITGPIVLMGHSIAGLYIRAYAARYPENLSGLIFVDSSTPLQEDRLPAELVKQGSSFELLKLKWICTLGIPRVLGQCTHGDGFTDSAGKMIAEDQCRPTLFTAIAQESKTFRLSGNETVHTGPFGDLPILIFSEDPSSLPPELSAEAARSFSMVWNEMQEELKRLSTHSRRIIAKGSGHFVQIDRVGLLNQEVTNFINQVRGEAPKPTDYSSTKTE